MTFQCPEKTVFQQRTMVCNHEHMVNCSLSEKYYDTNLRIGQQNANLIDDGNNIYYLLKTLKFIFQNTHINHTITIISPYSISV